MNFELLDHPADIGFRAHGAGLEELFTNCAQALAAVIYDPSNVEGKIKYTLQAEGGDLESLLVNWLNEVLYHIDSRRIAFASYHLTFPRDNEVTCIALGEPRSEGKHPARLIVKAVTYHQLRLWSDGNGWSGEVYVDV